MRHPTFTAATAATAMLVLAACSNPDDNTNTGSDEQVTEPALAFDHMDLDAGPTAEFEWVNSTRPVATDDALYLLVAGKQEGTVKIAQLAADSGQVVAQTEPVSTDTEPIWDETNSSILDQPAHLVQLPAVGQPEALAIVTWTDSALDVRTYPLEFDRDDPGAHVWAGSEDDDPDWSALGTDIIITTEDEQVAISGHDQSEAVQPTAECQHPEQPEGSTFGDPDEHDNTPTVTARVDDQVFTETATGGLCVDDVPIESEDTPETADTPETTLIAANHDRALIATNQHAFVADLDEPSTEAEAFTGGSSKAPPLPVESRSKNPARSPDGDWVALPSVPEGPTGATLNMLSQAQGGTGADFITETGAFGPTGALDAEDTDPPAELVDGQGGGKLVGVLPELVVVTTEPIETNELDQESTQTWSYPVGAWTTS